MRIPIMSVPQQRFNCVCGGSYSSLSGLKQHQRRYCRGPPSSEENMCTVCNNRYNTYAGMRQHLKQAHPEAYNIELKAESANARAPWTEEEIRELAGEEANCDPELSGAAILDHLVQYSKRSRDAIKGRRRNRQYIELVRLIREERAEAGSAALAGETSTERNATSIEDDISNSNSEIKNKLLELRDKLSIRSDLELLEGLLYHPQDVAAQLLENWCTSLVNQYTRRTTSRVTNQSTPRTQIAEALNRPGLSRRRKRALEYNLAQMDYSQDLKSYAGRLLDGTECNVSQSMPATEKILNHYNEIFNTPSAVDTEPIKDRPIDSTRISDPILEEEIAQAISSSKSNSPGPDGATLKDIARLPKPRLVLLYNAIQLLEIIPRAFNKSRTLLIPKTSDNLNLTKNWRPITISSVFLRIYNKILAHRISARVQLNENQRGFTRIDGCFANNITLECLIKTRRKAGRPLSLISLDLSKAFDKVSHHSLRRALERKNIDGKTLNIIMGNYKDANTTITCNGLAVGDINIKRGVKQGDPLSPILFNIVLDELLCELEKKKGVQIINESALSVLAYADDIVLCAEDRDDAGRLLKTTVEFLEKRGLELNVTKSHSLVLRRVPSKKKVYVDTEPYYKINDEFISPITIQDELCYLGQKFSTIGLKKCTITTLYQQLSAIRRAPLKPQQKMEILRVYLIPRYIASLQKPNVSQKLLKDVDKKIRSMVRSTLHLNAHCSNSLFYAPLKSGGLGLFCFNTMIPVITRERMNNLRQASTLLRDTIDAFQPALDRINRQISPHHTNTTAVKTSLSEELHSSFNGKGLFEAKNHQACRKFIANPPKYWNGEQFIKAIQLRFNLLPTVGIPSNPPHARLCRAGCNKVESLSHVLQGCPLTHWKRIARHDFVLKRLINSARKHQWSAQREPNIRTHDGRLYKPDVILARENKVIVTDVGVNWEGEITLSMQYDNKKAIYSSPEFVEKLQQLYPEKEIYILPLIVGARGTWCAKNETLVNHLQMTKEEICEIINTVMRGGWTIHSDFMRTVWRSRHTRRQRRN